MQTLLPVLMKSRTFKGRQERLELEDGDFIDLVWHDAEGPLVLVLHGLEGSIDSHYASEMMFSLQKADYNAIFMHFRGCSGEANRLDRAYHSGDTGDIAAVVRHVTAVSGKPLEAIIGYSLSGNALLKWLGELGELAPCRKAVAVSVPFRLDDAARRLQRGGSRLYQRFLLRKMRQGYRRKFALRPSPLQVDVARLKDFFAFDDQVTAPLHGFDGVHDYYARSSCRQFLPAIRRSTLIIHAQDDPFMFPETAPGRDELSPSTTLELTQYGGHVGFIGGRFFPRRWLEQRIMVFLAS